MNLKFYFKHILMTIVIIFITYSILEFEGISKAKDIHEKLGFKICIINFTGFEKFGSS